MSRGPRWAAGAVSRCVHRARSRHGGEKSWDPGNRGTPGRLLRGGVPAPSPNELHSEGLTKQANKAELALTAPCSKVLITLLKPESLLVAPACSLASLTQKVKVSTDPDPGCAPQCPVSCASCCISLAEVCHLGPLFFLREPPTARFPWCPAQPLSQSPLWPPCLPSPPHHTNPP